MLYLEASTVKTTLGCPGCSVGHVTGLCYVGLCLFGFCPLLSLSWCRLCVVFRLAAPCVRSRVFGFGCFSCRCDCGLKLFGFSWARCVRILLCVLTASCVVTCSVKALLVGCSVVEIVIVAFCLFWLQDKNFVFPPALLFPQKFCLTSLSSLVA